MNLNMIGTVRNSPNDGATSRAKARVMRINRNRNRSKTRVAPEMRCQNEHSGIRQKDRPGKRSSAQFGASHSLLRPRGVRTSSASALCT